MGLRKFRPYSRDDLVHNREDLSSGACSNMFPSVRSSTGFMRQYPAIKWMTSEYEPDLYDARMREWYVVHVQSFMITFFESFFPVYFFFLPSPISSNRTGPVGGCGEYMLYE